MRILYKTILFSSFIILTISIAIFAQIVYTPPGSYVYDFLERLSLKNIIEYHDEVKPVSRKKIGELLEQALLRKEELNLSELKELDWLSEEYAYEIKKARPAPREPGLDTLKERWYLYNYSDSLFSLKISPLAGYGISAVGNNSGHTRWAGVNLFMTHSNWFGGSFYLKDHGEFGDDVDKERNFSPLPGAAYKPAPDGMEISDIRGGMTFNWNWGAISLMKDNVIWGHGKFGQLILSEKAPPFAFIRLDLNFTGWLRFHYIHGWLNSLVYDSSSFSYNHLESIHPFLRMDYINKYIAANFLSISVTPKIDLSVGNSIIYSGKLRPEFFIPFLFFKSYDNRGVDYNVEDGNKQLYFDAAVRLPKTFTFYGTLFIDCIEIRKLLKHDRRGTDFGFTLGGKKIDFFVPMLDMIVEYTKVNPWVYEHKDETTTYKHLNYYLGDWLGQNADQFRVQFDYRPLRGLQLTAYTEYIRKGRLLDIYYNYYDQIAEPFLQSPVRRESRFSFEASYEFIHDLFVDGYYTYSNVTDQDPKRTPAFMLGKKSSFGITVQYGL